MNGIVDVRPNMEFKIFIANYRSCSYRLTKKQAVENLLPQTGAVTATNINILEVLDVDTASTEEEQHPTNDTY